MVGAYFLDAGIEPVKKYILNMFQPLVETLVSNSGKSTDADNQNAVQPKSTFIDSKNRFQQWALANYQIKPTYTIIAESGPDHAKQFTAQVSILGEVYGMGTDRRKQEAEKRAAEMAIEKVQNE